MTNVNKKSSLATENIKKVILSKKNNTIAPIIEEKAVFEEVNDSKGSRILYRTFSKFLVKGDNI